MAGPQGQQGWAPEPTDEPQQVTAWTRPATSKAANGLAMAFTPVQIFASAFENMVKLQQKTWAAMIGATSSAVRDANRH